MRRPVDNGAASGNPTQHQRCEEPMGSMQRSDPVQNDAHLDALCRPTHQSSATVRRALRLVLASRSRLTTTTEAGHIPDDSLGGHSHRSVPSTRCARGRQEARDPRRRSDEVDDTRLLVETRHQAGCDVEPVEVGPQRSEQLCELRLKLADVPLLELRRCLLLLAPCTEESPGWAVNVQNIQISVILPATKIACSTTSRDPSEKSTHATMRVKGAMYAPRTSATSVEGMAQALVARVPGP